MATRSATRWDLAQHVRGQEYSRAAGDRLAHEREELALHQGIEAVCGLIEHEEIRPGAEGQQERQLATVAGRKRAHLRVEVHLQSLDEIVAPPAVQAAANAGYRCDELCPGHPFWQAQFTGHIRDAFTHSHSVAGRVEPEAGDATCRWLQHAQQAANGGRLPAPLGPRKPKTSPAATSKSIARSALTRPKLLTRPRTAITSSATGGLFWQRNWSSTHVK